jgi:endonuclease/exonuclease/phosphatase family metal-dependent hydrolase
MEEPMFIYPLHWWIDYIFTGEQFDVFQCSKFPLPYSDHHPVVADLQLK